MSNMVVQTNILALNSHRNMKNVGAVQSRASSRLSSGYRINNAADDAAGLAISEKMRSQIRGLDQASRNAQDAQALINTAEGGMQEIDNMVQRIRELVVQASTDTNDQAMDSTKSQGDRQKIQDEIVNLVQEIDSMASRVEFNGKRLIDGTYADGNQKHLPNIQTTYAKGAAGTKAAGGAGSSAAPTDAELEAAAAKTLEQLKSLLASEAWGKLYADATPSGGATPSSTALKNWMDKIITDTANADATITGLKTLYETGATSFAWDSLSKDDGTLYAAVRSAYTGDNKAEVLEIVTALRDIEKSVLRKTSESDFKTDFDSLLSLMNNGATGAVQGDNSGPYDYTKVTTAIKGDWTKLTGTANAAATNAGLKAVFDDTLNYAGARDAWDAVFAATTTDGVKAAWQNFANLLMEGNAKEEGAEGWTDTDVGKGRMFLEALKKDSTAESSAVALNGTGIALAIQAVADKLDSLAKSTGATPPSGGTAGTSLYFQVGANANQRIEANINSVTSSALGLGDGKTHEGGEVYINVVQDTGSKITGLLDGLNAALTVVTSERSKLGAISNRLDFTMKSLDVSSENLSDSESRIRDADMAQEMMTFTKSNVLQQAAISMLAQANQLPQNLLQLLR